MFRLLKQLLATLSMISLLATSSQAMFIQPDWFDPTQPGVGTNRYSYSFNDPINHLDPNGNEAAPEYDGAVPTERDLINEELSQLPDVISNPNLSTEEKIDHVLGLYARVNSFNARQNFFNNQAIGFGALASAMDQLRGSVGGVVKSPSTGASAFSPRSTASANSTSSTATPRSAYNINTQNMTAEERRSVVEYARRANQHLAKVGGTTVQSTAGTLRTQASSAARRERLRAARAGTPYSGQAGHVPDTALSGKASPPAGWLDMAGKSNNIAGGGLSSRIGTRVDVITIDGKIP